jgi:hypothetical protein
MSLDRHRLESLNVNGLDLILLLMHMMLEVVGSASPTGKDTDDRLTDIANRLDDIARQITEPRMKFLVGQLAVGLIATE